MKKEKGFTLIELLVVIAIIGILAILIFLAMQRAQGSARDAQRKAFARDLATAEAMYYDAHKTYGTMAQINTSGAIGQWPKVCPDGSATDPDTACATPAGARGAWGASGVFGASGSRWGVNVTCEVGGCHFGCDENGCRDSAVTLP